MCGKKIEKTYSKLYTCLVLYSIIYTRGKGKARAMDERQEEMNNQEFETFKKMLVLHLEELKGLESDPEAWKRKLETIIETLKD